MISSIKSQGTESSRTFEKRCGAEDQEQVKIVRKDLFVDCPKTKGLSKTSLNQVLSRPRLDAKKRPGVFGSTDSFKVFARIGIAMLLGSSLAATVTAQRQPQWPQDYPGVGGRGAGIAIGGGTWKGAQLGWKAGKSPYTVVGGALAGMGVGYKTYEAHLDRSLARYERELNQHTMWLNRDRYRKN